MDLLIRGSASAGMLARFAVTELRAFLTRAGIPPGTMTIEDDPDPSAVGRLAITLGGGARGSTTGDRPGATPPEAAGSFALRALPEGGGWIVDVVARDDQGLLNGVYDLLQRLGVRFYLDGEVVPRTLDLDGLRALDVEVQPRLDVRGIAPLHDFLNGPSVYSFEDWRDLLIRARRMRMNLLVLNSYAGAYLMEQSISEPFHSFSYRGVGYHAWLDTSVTSERWGLARSRADDLAFGAGELLPYDVLGSDAARFVDDQPDAHEHAFAKGKALFSRIFGFAASIGIAPALSLEFDILPFSLREAGAEPFDPEVIEARVDDVVASYPDLRYLFLGLHEFTETEPGPAAAALKHWYAYARRRRPELRLVFMGDFRDGRRFLALDPELPDDFAYAYGIPYDGDVASSSDALDAMLGSAREQWPVLFVEFDGGLSEPQIGVDAIRDRLQRLRDHGCRGVIAYLWRSNALRVNLDYVARDAWWPGEEAIDPAVHRRDTASSWFGPELADRGARLLTGIEATGFPKGDTPGFDAWAFGSEPDADARERSYAGLVEDAEAMVRDASTPQAVDLLAYWVAVLRFARSFWRAHHVIPEVLLGPGLHLNAGGSGRGGLDHDAFFSRASAPLATPGASSDDPALAVARVARVPGPMFSELQPLRYEIPCPPGDYRVSLTLLEPDRPSHRSFDVTVAGTRVREELMIDQPAGGARRPFVVQTELHHAGGILEIALIPRSGLPLVHQVSILPLDRPTVLPDEGWERLTTAGFQEAIEAYKDLPRSLPDLGGLVSAAGGHWFHAPFGSDFPWITTKPYRWMERIVRDRLELAPPLDLRARATSEGVLLGWRPDGENDGSVVLRRDPGGAWQRITAEPISETSFLDDRSGPATYAVRAVRDGKLSPPSLPVRIRRTGPSVRILAPPAACVSGERLTITAVVISEWAADAIVVDLRYRIPGGPWVSVEMRPSVIGLPKTRIADVPGGMTAAGVVEFVVVARDPDGAAMFPPGGFDQPSAVPAIEPSGASPAPPADAHVRVEEDGSVLLGWSEPSERGALQQVNIFRSRETTCEAAGDRYLTHVPYGVGRFRDPAPPAGTWTYRLEMEARSGRRTIGHGLTVVVPDPEARADR
jgi:hypothetical protein